MAKNRLDKKNLKKGRSQARSNQKGCHRSKRKRKPKIIKGGNWGGVANKL